MASVMLRSALAPRNKRLVNPEALGGLMTPPDRADPGNEADPIGGENENEDGRKEPERPLDQMPANDSFQKGVQALNQPFPEILCPFRHWLHVARCDLSKNDQAERSNPGDDHGVGDRQAEDAGDLDSLLREAVFLRLRVDCRTSPVFGMDSLNGRVR